MLGTPAAIVCVEQLSRFYAEAARAFGADDEEAAIYGDCFIRADLRHDTQGLPLWLEWAFPLVEAGGARFGLPLNVVQQTAASIQVDGRHGIGQIVGTRTMDRVVALARQSGVAIGLVSNTTDMAMAANYATRALDHGCIGLVTTTAGPATVAPWGGARAAFGTDPLAVAIPGGDGGPIIIDMCCATHSIGTLVDAARAGWVSPTPIVVDRAGQYVGDPAAIISDITVREPKLTGAILPEGVKGSALLFIMEVLAGLLTESGTSLDQRDWSAAQPPRVGAFMCVIDVARFQPIDRFTRTVAGFAAMLRAMTPAQGFDAVRLPGDRAARLEAERRESGIAVSTKHWPMILELCHRLGLAVPEARLLA